MSEPTTLIDLVSHYSPSGFESEAAAYLVKRMKDLGFEQAFTDSAGNAVGVIGHGPRQILLLGHIDTVPGEIDVEILEITDSSTGERESYLRGRGSVDAKGPLAAFVDAAASIGAVKGWQFVVIGAVDEERESTGARHIVDKYRPDYAIIGEPSNWDRVTLGYKGSAWAEVSVERPMAHTAGKDESTPEAAIKIWNRIRAWADNFNASVQRLFDQILITLQEINTEGDGFSQRTKMLIGARLPLSVSPEKWYQVLQEITAPEISRPTGFSIPAYSAEKNTPLVRAFLGSIRAEGGKPRYVVKTGTADLNIVAPIWGCPSVAYGPGDSNLDHSPHEQISLAEYQQAVVVLRQVLKVITKD